MKKEYKIEVDCANCANKIETMIASMEQVEKVTVNFLFQKLILEFKDGTDEKSLLKIIKKKAKKIEPDFDMQI